MSEDNRCDTCAFRPGCVTFEKEPHNRLRAEVCVAGPLPFYCHYSNAGDWSVIELGTLNNEEASSLRHELKICEGWRAAVKKEAAAGAYADPETRKIRQWAARHALQKINEFIRSAGEVKAAAGRELENVLKMLARSKPKRETDGAQ